MKDTNCTAVCYDLMMSVLDPLLIKRWRRRLWAQVRGTRILEAGAGTGLNIPCYSPGYRVTAFEKGSYFLERARRRARDRSVPVEFVLGDVQSLPYPDDTFDTAVSTFLFCQLNTPLEGLRELLRVLKPGGLLLLLEHVRSEGRTGRLLCVLAGPFYRLTGDHIARDTVNLTRQAGFVNVTGSPLFMDVVKLIRAEKQQ